MSEFLSRRWVGFFVMALAAAAGAVACLTTGDSEGPTQTAGVEVVFENRTVGVMPFPDALRKASDLVGFTVRAPSGATTESLILYTIRTREIPSADIRPPGRDPDLTRAELEYGSVDSPDDRAAIKVIQHSEPTNVRFIPSCSPGEWECSEVDLGPVTALVQESSRGDVGLVVIVVRWDNEGFDIKADALMKEEAIELARALIDAYDD